VGTTPRPLSRVTALLVAALLTAAACAPTSAPSPSATTPVSAPTVVPTLTPTVAPTLTPTATPGPGSAIIARFLENFAEAQPPFHVLTEVEGTVVSGAEKGEVSARIEGDISGQDLDGSIHTEAGDVVEDYDVIIVGGVAYARVPGGTWIRNPTFRQTQPLNPFGLLDPADLAYVGPAERGGEPRHQLRTTIWIGDEIVLEGFPDAALEHSTFDIYVDEEGIPHEAVLVFAITATRLGIPVDFDYVVDYTFTNVGVPVTIEAPIP